MPRPLTLDPDRLFPADPAVRAIARALYTGIARLPIVSPHGHTDARWFADDEPWKDAIVVKPPVMDADGFFTLPDGPGLGIELDVAAAARFPPATVRPPAVWHEDGSVADW